MNFKAMPELQWEYGYPVALLAISSVCLFLYKGVRLEGEAAGGNRCPITDLIRVNC